MENHNRQLLLNEANELTAHPSSRQHQSLLHASCKNDKEPTSLLTQTPTIPHPISLPSLNRRRFLQLSAAAVALAAISLPKSNSLEASQITPLPTEIDEADPIGKKWVKLGGEDTIGASTSEIIQTSDGSAKYQKFENGVIIYSKDWGAMLVSQKIFDRWLRLESETNGNGDNLLSYMGFPKQDYVSTPNLQIGYFERGMILVNLLTNDEHIVYGMIYAHYWSVRDVVGLPIELETDAPNGGRFQSFERGDIYWRDDTGASEVHGAIRRRWLDLGGAGASLGYPLSDEEVVKQNGDEIGRVSRFENGVIYWSSSTGAWEMTGEIRRLYEHTYGGVSSQTGLGLPRSAQNTTTSGNIFQNFQQGVLIQDTKGQVWIFSKLELFIQRLQGYGDDCIDVWPVGPICGSQDLFVYIDITTSDGTEISVRRPTSGEYDAGGEDLQETFKLTPGSNVVHSDLIVNIRMEGWDEDLAPNGDDRLGTIEVTYTIDNLWGLFDGGEHRDGNFVATYSIRNPVTFDPNQFRQQLWWSFENFDTDALTYDQFAATFSDVAPDESAFWHPFNRLYYELVYKSIAQSGNCFGMSLESIYAQAGRSLYSEPIIRFWPDTQNGSELDPNNPTHRPTINELNIKQGYQVGASNINWVLDQFVQGKLRNPKECFIDSRAAFERGDYPVLCLGPVFLKLRGHAVRPYRWDDSNPNLWIIYIADPNLPAKQESDDQISDDNNERNRIEVNPNANTFTYLHGDNDTWTGGKGSGGRLFHVPFRRLSDQPRTPFWEVLALISSGTLIILGSDGQTKQITDENGRTFYEPNLTGPPTQWDDIETNDTARIENFARVPVTDGAPGDLPYELYYARGKEVTYKHEVLSANDVTDGTPYEWVLNSATLSARLLIPGSSDTADLITVQDIGTATKAVSVTIPPNGSSKQLTWTMAGPVKHRWLELSELDVVPEQTITIRLDNGGYEAIFENDGPTTTAKLTVQSGQGASPVEVGEITIPSGESSDFQFDTPLTTMRFSGDTRNSSGWLVGPAVIELTARDYSSLGIETIQHASSSQWISYNGPFLYSEEGKSTFYYRSRDNEGNQEAANSLEFKIDTVPPQSALEIGQPQGGNEVVTVSRGTPLTLTASDASSGVRSVSYRYFLQNADPPAYTTIPGDITQFMIDGSTGNYEIQFFASDVAGNDEEPTTQIVHLGVPTAISVTHISVTQNSEGVLIQWQTSNATTTFGYHIYRNDNNRRDDAIRITEEMILARNSTAEEDLYDWMDRSVDSEKRYYYWLEEVLQNGATEQHGPIISNISTSTVYLPLVNYNQP